MQQFSHKVASVALGNVEMNNSAVVNHILTKIVQSKIEKVSKQCSATIGYRRTYDNDHIYY